MSIAFLSVGSIVSYSVYAEDEDDYNSSTSLDQNGSKSKCKIGVFGDSQASVPSTISGLCNQQGQNNVDSGISLGGIGISMGRNHLQPPFSSKIFLSTGILLQL